MHETQTMDNLTWRRLSVECMSRRGGVTCTSIHTVCPLSVLLADTDSSNCFLGKDLFTPFGSRGVYGGQVFAQALVCVGSRWYLDSVDTLEQDKSLTHNFFILLPGGFNTYSGPSEICSFYAWILPPCGS